MIRRVPVFLLLAFASTSFAQDASRGPSAALLPFIENGSLAGAVTLVAGKDKVLSLEAVGYSDVQAKTPMKTNAEFWIASMSKPITAIGLMMLVDEGKVMLDDPVAKYLPEFNNVWLAAYRDNENVLLKRPKQPILVRHLLDHTSGLPFRSELEVPTLDRVSLRDAALSYAMTPLQSEPGTKYSYSNAGINTIGRIIEVVSKMPYEDFMSKRLFKPLGMKDTTFWPSEGQLARLAKSYKPAADKMALEETNIWALSYPLTDRKRQPMPAGGLFSTAEDLGRLCRMMLRGGELDGKRFLSEAAVHEMSKRQTPKELKDSYGLGWTVGDGWIGHGGAYSTDMVVNTKLGLVLVYLVQHNGFPGKGRQAKAAFHRAAETRFGKPHG